MQIEAPRCYANILDTIGNTPVVRVRCFDTGPCELYVKLENQNPGGSIKDRVAKSMIEAAEASAALQPGGLMIEATAGNTGLGLALIAACKGYRLLLVVPDKMSIEKIAGLKAYGAEVVITRSDVGKGHPEYYQDYAERLAREKGAFYVNQFNNPANPLAHERTTAVEIWQQLDHRVDAVVCGVGSGGTITGLSRFFAHHAPDTAMVLADPQGSILTEYVKTGRISSEVGSWLVEGIGEDFIPPIVDLSRVREAYTISDRESFLTARELLKKEGILAGSSSGTLIAAAVRYCQEQHQPRRVVTFVCDSGNKYFSKMLSDNWMISEGLIERPRTNDLRDLIARFHSSGETVFVGPDDDINKAHTKMRLHAISQLPVLSAGKVLGIIDESDILAALALKGAHFDQPVKAVMTSPVRTLPVNTAMEDVVRMLGDGYVPIVMDGEKFLGLVTRSDIITYMRLNH